VATQPAGSVVFDRFGVQHVARAVRERWEQLERRRVILEIARLADGRLLAGAIALALLGGASVPAFVLASGYLLGALPAAIAGREGTGDVWLYVTLAASAFAALQIASPLQAAVGQLIARRIDGVVRDRLATAVVVDAALAQSEDPEIAGSVVSAKGQLEFQPTTPGTAVVGALTLLTRYSQMIGAAVLVAVSFSPWAALGFVLAGMGLRSTNRLAMVRFGRIRQRTIAKHAEADYYRQVGIEPAAGKELRLFGISGWFRERHSATAHGALAEEWPHFRRVYGVGFARPTVFAVVVAAAVLAWLGESAAHGDVSLRDLTIAVQAGYAVVGVGVLFFETDWQTEWGVQPYVALRRIEEKVAVGRQPPSFEAPPADLPGSIRFERVSFSYPGSSVPVLDELDLEIPAGRSLAIVGANGAGKTTLIKLLARLYEPTDGTIKLDGREISKYDLSAWRRSMAVIFQDFLRYELPAVDNIGFGSLELHGDRCAIRAVADRAGVLKAVEDLPRGFDSPLVSSYRDGRDLSGGEWQRVAIARALLAMDASANLLVLDEPTASLDVRAEAEFYRQFSSLTRGVTSILISHRFSTVRHANRIAVLERGRVVESGSHEELMRQRGLYAEMFGLQAARFADGRAARTNRFAHDDEQ
jgi:ATP-binding cassette subfamily B protein